MSEVLSNQLQKNNTAYMYMDMVLLWLIQQYLTYNKTYGKLIYRIFLAANQPCVYSKKKIYAKIGKLRKSFLVDKNKTIYL